MKSEFTRRELLGRTSIYGAGISLAMASGLPLAQGAAAASSKPASLDDAQWCTLEAMTGRLIPSGKTPGAVEANCVNFIDKALAHEEQSAASMVREGVTLLDSHCQANWHKPFCKLRPDQQDALLRGLEDGEISSWPADAEPSSQFFGYVRALTIMGFLADPKYGGNRAFGGWQVAGYPGPRHHRGGYTNAQMMGEEDIVPIWE